MWVRYLERCGEVLPFPQNGYRGDYLLPLAVALQGSAQAGDLNDIRTDPVNHQAKASAMQRL